MLILTVLLCASLTNGEPDYWSQRQRYDDNYKLFPGSGLKEGYIEKCFSKNLKNFTSSEIKENSFLAAGAFTEATGDSIRSSTIFKLIKSLPKGGNLHGHDIGSVSQDFVFNLTHEKHLYGCYDLDKKFNFRFMANGQSDDSCTWRLLKEFRKRPSFDPWLKSEFFIDQTKYKNSNVWSRFNSSITLIKQLITYKPIYKKYFYQALKELHEDNVQYWEFRSSLPELYGLDGTVTDYLETAEILKDTVNRFKKKFRKFFGAKLIYAPQRPDSAAALKEHRREMRRLKKKMGSFLAGFDFSGEEEANVPLETYGKQLAKLSRDHKLMLHAGETSRAGSKPDLNILDAVAVKSFRIGHAYTLYTHHNLIAQVIEDKLAIELCPISNQVFGLVSDLTSHPARIYFKLDIPVVIGNDYPGLWGAKGLSYDLYYAFMGMAETADIRFFKEMALNSFQYSAMSTIEKTKAIRRWTDLWELWLTS